MKKGIVSVYRLAKQLLYRYSRHRLGYRGAAIAYDLLFTLFPLLLFFSGLLGSLQIDLQQLTAFFSRIIPAQAEALAEAYLQQASRGGASLWWIALFFSAYFSARTVGALLWSVRESYGAKRPEGFLRDFLPQLLYALLLLLLLVLAAVTLPLGKNLLLHFTQWLPVSGLLLSIWEVGRFALLGAGMLLALCLLYRMGGGEQRRDVLPGALAILAAWLPVSAVFTWYVGHFGRYSLLYGSLAAVMVTLLWLWLSAVLILLGAEINALLRERRGKQGLSA